MRTKASDGGKYHRWSEAKYFRVAASLTPQASFARRNGNPVRRHSSRIQSLSGSSMPFDGNTFLRTYWAHTSVTTGYLRIVRVLQFPATWDIPLFQM